MAIGVAIRMAGPKLLQFLKGNQPMAQFLGYRILPDAGFAALNAVTTPGGLDDKLIAGVTDFGLSAGTGLVAGGAARRFGASPLTENIIDGLGSYAGAMAGYPAGMALTRAADKLTGGPGLTDFEKMAQKDQEALIQQIQEQTLANAGLVPGFNPAYYGTGNDYLAQLGLG